MRTFVVNYSGKPLLNLKEDFGEDIIFITEGTVNIFDTYRIKYDIKKCLLHFNFNKDDGILFSGPVILNFLTGEVFSELNLKNYTMVLHNAKEQKYISIQIKMPNDYIEEVDYKVGSSDGKYVVKNHKKIYLNTRVFKGANGGLYIIKQGTRKIYLPQKETEESL